MANVKPWHRKAPAKKAGEAPAKKPWAKNPAKRFRDPNKISDLPIYEAYEPLMFDPWSRNDDGSVIPREMRCVEAPDAGLKRLLKA